MMPEINFSFFSPGMARLIVEGWNLYNEHNYECAVTHFCRLLREGNQLITHLVKAQIQHGLGLSYLALALMDPIHFTQPIDIFTPRQESESDLFDLATIHLGDALKYYAHTHHPSDYNTAQQIREVLQGIPFILLRQDVRLRRSRRSSVQPTDVSASRRSSAASQGLRHPYRPLSR